MWNQGRVRVCEIVPVCFPLELVDFYPVIDGMSQEISESLIQLAQKES